MKKKQNKSATSIRISGDLTIPNIGSIHQGLLDAINAGKRKVIFENIESIDLAGIQLLQSVKNENDGMELDLKLSQELHESIEAAGFNSIVNN